ncbi:MAG TPA: translation factor GTPase family protein [Streptosporangiaceae bacterium]|nr:translation factor GTPase family protein [Streptosporangiaceae bacterium]
MARGTLNLGILAHVDAGKTTLTERLLYAAGVIDQIGSVDDGTTQTDSLALERQRGITIKAAVASFAIGNVAVNLIDTPGHPDFIAEVERALSVLDGAVLVISAVEGVQPQTRILMRALQRLHVPMVMFVNKIDRRGAGYDRLLRDISGRLTPAIVAMGSAHELGTREAGFTEWDGSDPGFKAGLTEVLAEHHEAIMAAYIRGEPLVSYPRLRAELAAQTRRGHVVPVYFGSALTGVGVDALMSGLTELLPTAGRDVDGPASGRVFKIERGTAGEKIAYVRMFSGTVRTRDRLRVGPDRARKVTAISVFADGSDARRASVSAGQIGKLWGLAEIRVGDAVGSVPTPAGLMQARRARAERHQFAPPTLETVVVPCDPDDRGALRAALAQLAEQDPLINVRQDDTRQEISVSLFGEVQKEVIGATLAADYGLGVSFRETTTICVERLLGTGAALERLREAPNPFLATIGLRVDPAAAGSGVTFRIEVELGSMPIAFFRATEDTMRETLRQGMHGWEIPDCTVTLTHSGYLGKQSLGHQRFNKAMSSTGEDYRRLTPLVVMSAVQQAGTVVCEPVHRFRLDAPADTLGPLLAALARRRAVPHTQSTRGASLALEGDIPAARVHDLRQELPALTRGEGVLECAFDRYEPVIGVIPTRPRLGPNPLDREEYLRQVTRRATLPRAAMPGRRRVHGW